MHIARAMMFFMGAAIATFAAPAAPIGDDFASDISRIADELDVPGMAVQVVSNDHVIDQAVVGFDGNGTAVDSQTPFVWGSVSKSITALTVAKLAERSLVDLDDPVEAVLPESNSIEWDHAVTIRDLIHHTSGLPHDVSQLDVRGRTSTALDAVPTLHVQAADRGTFGYSSLNYLLLQAVVEKVTGDLFADVVSRETGVDSSKDAPPGHVPFFTFPRPVEVGSDGAGLGYGYTTGSIDQLGRYASTQLDDLASNTPDATARRADTVPTGPGTAYGYGWYVERLADGTEMRWHSGAVPGYFTHIALIPDRDLAVVLVMNRYGQLEDDQFASAARSLVLAQIGIAEPRSSRAGMYYPVLVGLAGSALVLALCATRILLRFSSGETRWVRTRILASIAAGVALYVLVPIAAGAPISAVARWAPDVALLYWILLGELAVVAIGLTLRGFAAGARKFVVGYEFPLT